MYFVKSVLLISFFFIFSKKDHSFSVVAVVTQQLIYAPTFALITPHFNPPICFIATSGFLQHLVIFLTFPPGHAFITSVMLLDARIENANN